MTRVFLLMALLAPVAAQAEIADPPGNQDDAALLRSQEILANPEAFADAEIARSAPQVAEEAKAKWGEIYDAVTDRSQAIAQGAVDEGKPALIAANDPAAEPRGPVRHKVLVTQAMPLEELRSLAALSAARKDLVLVFRGLKQGQKILAMQQVVHDITAGMDRTQPPSIEIDPTPFSDLRVSHAPVLVRYDDTGKVLGYAAGLSDPDWLDARLASEKGDLGTYGPVVPVAEEDMIDLLKASAEKIDWEAKKEKALASFFPGLKAFDLPVAAAHRLRRIDPSFIVEETVTAPDGSVVAFAGQRINPLDTLPFTQVLVVFDPGNPDDLALIADLIPRTEGRRLTLMATRLREVGSFDAYADLVDRIGRPVYTLVQEAVDRFQIQATPTVIWAQDREFVVEEVPPGMKAMEANNAGAYAQHR